MKRRYALYAIIVLMFNGLTVCSQNAVIKEEQLSLDTYYFDDPNPVPILKDNPKIFPYHKFESYSHTSEKKEWTVVTLENDYIKVLVLPEIGGKVWGAIEKSTGGEFLYKNEVIKFRNIAMRGPWTSGGIEFNFGIIGHHPSTATPVDYAIRENEDGSVSCIVGNLDLPSRTSWRVEIKLEKDKAYFETNASWYNPTPINQSYYNWMTAAAVATEDLEFFIPGDEYLKHNGDALPWPVDKKNRNLAFYKNNNFGPSKSYHIVGDYKDFFGGYYHDRDFGFGHWSPYEEMPGQKLWLWALSRSGGIWEDLLTDTDGQYIEFQAGRLLNQYFPGAVNPISQANFEPYVMDRWREIWFPIKAIGGMEAANEYGVLNVEYENNGAKVGFNALQRSTEEIAIKVNGNAVFSEQLDLQPMGVYTKDLPLSEGDTLEVVLGEHKLYYSNIAEKTLIKRPFHEQTDLEVSETQQLFMDGWEALKYREFEKALESFSSLVALDPSHLGAWAKLAELEYRRTNYVKALEYVNKALKIDTYNSEANYLAGISYRALQDHINALESFGWAARDMKYRSVSYAQMAEIYFITDQSDLAKTYARKALNYNTFNLNARQLLLLVARLEKDEITFKKEIDELLKIDPLNRFAIMEDFFLNGKPTLLNSPKTRQNEYRWENLLETALQYYGLNRTEDARAIVLEGDNTKNLLWMAYLLRESGSELGKRFMLKATQAPADFVFPYRRETLEVLKWAATQDPNWKFKFYLAQNYLAVGLKSEGEKLLRQLGEQPNSDVFYRFRAKYLDKDPYDIRFQDYERALGLNNKDWKAWEEFIQFNLNNKRPEKAYDLSKKAYKKFKDNYNIGLSHAKAALHMNQYTECIEVLTQINILPFEHASESKQIYDNAHIFLAYEKLTKSKYEEAIKLLEASKEWPENLGVGKPYDVDSRLPDYLLAMAYEKIGNVAKANQLLKQVADYSISHIEEPSLNHIFGLYVLDRLKNTEELLKMSKLLKENAVEEQRSEMVMGLYNNQNNTISALKKELNISEELLQILQFRTK